MRERPLEIQDRVSVDRAVLAASIAYRRHARALWLDPASARERSPWAQHRPAAVKSLYDALGEKPPSDHERELVAALRSHVMFLTIARVSAEAETLLAVAANDPAGVVDAGTPTKGSWRTAIENVLAGTRPVSHASMIALAECAPGVASAAHALAERRLEAAKRLGQPAPDVGLSPGRDYARAAARTLLDVTQDLADDLARRELARADRSAENPRPEDTWIVAAGKPAEAGWPSRLRARWLEELFGERTRGLSLDLELPRFVAGASTFARALEAFGVAFRRAVTRGAVPFVLGDDPVESAAHASGALFGSLASSPVFQRRALGLGPADVEKNARTLGLTALIEARVRAARVLLGIDLPSRPLFEEVTHRVFRAGLDPRLFGAWPIVRSEDVARFVAVVRAPAELRRIVDRFDDDWFKNPRAFDALRHERLASPSFESRSDAEAAGSDAAKALGRSLEEVLA